MRRVWLLAAVALISQLSAQCGASQPSSPRAAHPSSPSPSPTPSPPDRTHDVTGKPAGEQAQHTAPSAAAVAPITSSTKAAYVVVMVDMFSPATVEWFFLFSMLRKIARDKGIPDDRIITVSRFSTQWFKAILTPTAGVNASTLPGAPKYHYGQNMQPDKAWSGTFAAVHDKLFPKSRLDIPQLPHQDPGDTADRREKVLAAFKQKGMDPFEEFDYYGEDMFTSHTLRGILNGECPLQQQQQPGRPCKVIPKPTRDGETHSVLVWTLLHGSDPFNGAARTKLVRELDVFGLIREGESARSLQLVDLPVTGDSSFMFFNYGDTLTGKQVQALFTTGITNPAVRNGERVVVIGSCYGGSLVEHAFEKLTRKTAADEQGYRVSTLLDPTHKKTYIGPTTDKVLFIASQDRYMATTDTAFALASLFLSSTVYTFNAIVSDVRLKQRAKSFENSELISSVLSFLREHAAALQTALAHKDSKPQEFEAKKAWLKQELLNRAWHLISLTKRFSIVAALSGQTGGSRVRIHNHSVQDLQQHIVNKLGAWGNRELFNTRIEDFLMQRHLSGDAKPRFDAAPMLRGIPFVRVERAAHADPQNFYEMYFDRDRTTAGKDGFRFDMYRPEGNSGLQKRPVADAYSPGLRFALDLCTTLVTAPNMRTESAFYVPIIEAALYNAGAELSATAAQQIVRFAESLALVKDPIGHVNDLQAIFKMSAEEARRVGGWTCGELVQHTVDDMVKARFWNYAGYRVATPKQAEEPALRAEICETIAKYTERPY